MKPTDRMISQAQSNMKKYTPFNEATCIDLEVGAGVDTSFHQDDWRDVCPKVEIVTADFEDVRKVRKAEKLAVRQVPKEITYEDLDNPEYEEFRAGMAHAQEIANSLIDYVQSPDFAAGLQTETQSQSQQLCLF